MIKSEDCRIGNWFTHNNHYVQVYAIGMTKVMAYVPDLLESKKNTANFHKSYNPCSKSYACWLNFWIYIAYKI